MTQPALGSSGEREPGLTPGSFARGASEAAADRPWETLVVPFHVGEYLPDFPAPAGAARLAPALPYGTAQERMVALFGPLAARIAAGGDFLVYSGDCMAPIGVLAGLARRAVRPFVVWFDAHGDFNTWDTTPSGYIGGMPVAMLVGRGEQTIVRGVGLESLEPNRIRIADARDLDPAESVALHGSGVAVVSVEEAAGNLPEGVPVHVHLDVDVVDPSEMPALRFPAPGGSSLARVEDALRALAATGRVICATVACTWDPSLPEAGAAFAATARLVAALGDRRGAP